MEIISNFAEILLDMMENDIEKLNGYRGVLALSPIFVFVLFYLGVSMLAGDFYKMPVSVAFIVASVWAILITKGSLSRRIDIFSRGAANSDILYMIWIFILAGAFAALAKGIGAIDATVNLTLSVIPSQFVLPGMFIAACFVSLSIGTSVGTVTALVPLAVHLAEVAGGGDVALYVAVVLGGSFFGDNLSFISDTTIAATRTQGCRMNEKFKANINFALPAALVVLVLYYFIGVEHSVSQPQVGDINYWLVAPYLLVIALALAGVNVMVVLMSGVAASLLLGEVFGYGFVEMSGFMGSGIEGMGGLITVTLLSAGLLALIEHNGGIKFLIDWLTGKISGTRMAEFSIALLTGAVNVCTANNTIAILTVGNLSRGVSEKFGIAARKSASILDTSSCIVQCVIPYGAQMLLATGLAGISPLSLFEYMYYPAVLAVALVLSILIPSFRK